MGKNQVVYELKKPDLFWQECDVFQSGILVRWWQKDGKSDEVLFVTTKLKTTGKQILKIYNQRSENEKFSGIGKAAFKKIRECSFSYSDCCNWLQSF